MPILYLCFCYLFITLFKYFANYWILSNYTYHNWNTNEYYDSFHTHFIKFNQRGGINPYLYQNLSSSVTQTENKIVTIRPNPFSESTTIELNETYNDLIFNVFDMNGRLLRSEKFNGNRLDLERKGLDGGMYIYEIVTEKKVLQKGKIVVF